MQVAIVEDSVSEAEALKQMLAEYAGKHELTIETAYHKNAIVFLNNYHAKYDLIFMDIQMPYMNGMTAAEKLREIDAVTPLIFVTNLAQMAAQGYLVSAFAFLVKPLEFETFSMHMDRFLRYMDTQRDTKVILAGNDGKICLSSSDILYVEAQNHHLIYHTRQGDYTVYNTLKCAREVLTEPNFSLCSSCYLVNLRYVRSIKNYTVQVQDTELQISHPRRKAFLEALNLYIGG